MKLTLQNIQTACSLKLEIPYSTLPLSQCQRKRLLALLSLNHDNLSMDYITATTEKRTKCRITIQLPTFVNGISLPS